MNGDARERPRQRSLHCPPDEQEMTRARAKAAGKSISRHVLDLAQADDLDVHPLALDADAQLSVLDGVLEIRALMSGRRDAKPPAEDMQTRVAAMFAAWADGMLDAGRAADLRAALAAVRGERRADVDMSRLTRNRALRRDAGGRGRERGDGA